MVGVMSNWALVALDIFVFMFLLQMQKFTLEKRTTSTVRYKVLKEKPKAA